MKLGERVCPQCGAAEPIGEKEEIWPPKWRCKSCGHSIVDVDGIPMFAPAFADTISGFDPKVFSFLAAVEGDHFWFVPRNRLIVGLVEKFFPQASRFLEVGCGTGMVLSGIAASKSWRHLVGSELHPTGLQEARGRLGERAQFVQMDARKIPAREAFDVIGAFDVIEHILEDEVVIGAMRDAVVIGGGIILAVPQHPFLWSKNDEHAHHVRRYRSGELEKKVLAAGLRITFSGSYTTLLLPFMALSRLLFRGSSSNESVNERRRAHEVEFRLPRALNKVLKLILQAEVSASLAGVRFPAGGSRIVVAVKR
jgi:SAM-dependent methyltransferase